MAVELPTALIWILERKDSNTFKLSELFVASLIVNSTFVMLKFFFPKNSLKHLLVQNK